MSEDNKNKKLFDFFYLDFERIRSYSAQLFGGVTDSQTSSSSSSGEVSGGIPIVSGKVNYYKSDSETKSLHHKLYLNVEEELARQGKVYFINEDNSPDVALPFIKFVSEIQILDYTDIGNRLSDLFELVEGINSINKTNTQVNIGIKKKDVRAIADLIKRLYGDTKKINYVRNGNLFTQSSLQPQLIQHGFTELITNQKSILKNKWITFAQVIKKSDLSSVENSGLNQIDQAIVSMLGAFDSMEELLNTKTDLSIIPISIYREL